MKKFHKVDIPVLERTVDATGSRVYKTPTGNIYPSVTSVLSVDSEESIAAWKAAVGLDEANLTSTRAANRGTRIHSFCEDYILGKNPTMDMFDSPMAKSLVPYLDRIDEIYCLETPLYSDHLKVAGTVDCIARYDGKLAIIDFKTSSRRKHSDEITSYYKQMAAYAVMFEELVGIPISNLYAIMAVDFDIPQIYHEKRDDWIKPFIETRHKFKQLKGY